MVAKVSIRKPFQGVWNVILFNWHYYAFSIAALLTGILLLSLLHLPDWVQYSGRFGLGLLVYFTFASLVVSWWVYDQSALYRWQWVREWIAGEPTTLLNIHAGFDETSAPLRQIFTQARWEVADFYNPAQHTEISIARARRKYPAPVSCQSVCLTALPYVDSSFQHIFVFFAAHEIRNTSEQVQFFRELKRVLQPDGSLLLMEHLRDAPNFLAFGSGFTHFYSRYHWVKVVEQAGLRIEKERHYTPFVRIFSITL